MPPERVEPLPCDSDTFPEPSGVQRMAARAGSQTQLPACLGLQVRARNRREVSAGVSKVFLCLLLPSGVG